MNPATSSVEKHPVVIVARDGVPLSGNVFGDATSETKGIVFFANAMGVRQERYEPFARFLAARGLIALTFDYRGMGASRREHPKRCSATLTDWAHADMSGVLDFITNYWPHQRVAGIGHSIGGQLMGLVDNANRMSALLLVGAQRGFPRYWTGPVRHVIRAMWFFMPHVVRLYGYLPLRLAGCEDLPPGVALEWTRWGVHPEFRDREMRSLSPVFANYGGSLLSYSFSDDVYAPAAAAAALVRTYAGAWPIHRHFHPRDLGLKAVGHSGFFQEGLCSTLWLQAAQWLSTELEMRSGTRARPPVQSSSRA